MNKVSFQGFSTLNSFIFFCICSLKSPQTLDYLVDFLDYTETRVISFIFSTLKYVATEESFIKEQDKEIFQG